MSNKEEEAKQEDEEQKKKKNFGVALFECVGVVRARIPQDPAR